MRLYFTAVLMMVFLTACENPFSNQEEKLELLYSAIEDGDKSKINELLSKKLINNRLEDREYPILYAASLSQEDIVLQMLEIKPNLLVENHIGNNLLHVAIENKLDKVATRLIEGGTIEINKKNNFGYTALQFAADNGNVPIVKLLLSNNADPNIPNDEGFLPIHRAALSNQLELLEIFLSKMNIDAQDNTGNTPLNYAVSQLNIESSKWLLEKGANVNLANNDGFTPLAMAVLFEDENMVKLLLEYEADKTLEVDGQKIVNLTDNQVIQELLMKGE